MIPKIPYNSDFSGLPHIDQYPSLAKYRSYSINILKEINKQLNEIFSSDNFSVAVAGSYGRLEACESSDFDYIILYNETPKDLLEIKAALNDILRQYEIPSPNPTGVFSEDISVTDMIKNMGGDTDTLPSLAQRMLLLTECRPVYNSVFF